jgi:hypothetical protein
MKIFLVIAAVGFLVGCASLGLAPASSTQEQIAYGYSGVTAALNTLASATSSGIISSQEATTANTAILAVKGELDSANSALATDAPTAVKLLTAATSALAGISTYLACKQAKEATCQLP